LPNTVKSIYFMNSNYGFWFYDEAEEDITKAITLEKKDFTQDTKKPEDIKLLKKILNSKYFNGNDLKTYKVSEEPEKLFLEYIPKVYNFEPNPRILGPVNPVNSDEFEVFTKIKNIIENTFEIPLSKITLPQLNIYEIPNYSFIGSKKALKNRYLAQGSIDDFLKEDNDYFIMGFWGHGINSYAFYYIRTDPKSKIFLRLPYGGGYMDNDKEKVRIKNYLTRFFSLEKKLSKITQHTLAIESMGESYFKLRLKNGETFNYELSFYYSEENYQELSEMINKLL
jgi:hypothetical protein